MTLLELCEPLFQYVCRLNRSARKGGAHEAPMVRADLQKIFADMYSRSLSTPGLRDQYEKVRVALVCFVDYMVRTSKVSFAQDWKAMAEDEDPPIYTGDDYFFDPELKKTMEEKGAAGDERLAVFYTCMGLGFLGAYETDPGEVKNKMKEIAGRIRTMMDTEEAGRVCPEAYEATNRADLTEPPLRPLTPLAVALAGMMIVFFVANIYLYRSASKELRESLDQIVVQSDGALKAGGNATATGAGGGRTN